MLSVILSKFYNIIAYLSALYHNTDVLSKEFTL